MENDLKKAKEEQITEEPKYQKEKFSFSKLLVVWLLANGTAWIWFSYWLAFLGKDEIAETLSKVVATEILGVFALYAVKAALENLSKNNNWPDKKNGSNEYINEDPDC